MDPFIDKPLKDVTINDLQRLIDNAIMENLYLEYKGELCLNGKDTKKEFLKDLTAFANSMGGLIIFGIEEERDKNGKSTGLPISIPGISISNKDGLTLTIENLLRDCIDERLPSYEINFVDVNNGNNVLMIRIGPSMRAPHMVTHGKEAKFYLRVNGANQQMTTPQIRDSVLKTYSMEERIQLFIDKRFTRLKEIHNDDPFFSLSFIPVCPFPASFNITDNNIVKSMKEYSVDFANHNYQFCIDGYKAMENTSDEKRHIVFFRNGTIEYFKQIRRKSSAQKDANFAYKQFHEILSNSIIATILFYKEQGYNSLFAFSVILENYSKIRLSLLITDLEQHIPDRRPDGTIRPELLLVTDYDSGPNKIIQPIMDYIWNAYGRQRCPAYDEDGNYIGYDKVR